MQRMEEYSIFLNMMTSAKKISNKTLFTLINTVFTFHINSADNFDLQKYDYRRDCYTQFVGGGDYVRQATPAIKGTRRLALYLKRLFELMHFLLDRGVRGKGVGGKPV